MQVIAARHRAVIMRRPVRTGSVESDCARNYTQIGICVKKNKVHIGSQSLKFDTGQRGRLAGIYRTEFIKRAPQHSE